MYTPPILDYVCPLLQKLNLDNINGTRDGLKHSPAKGLLSLDELKALAREQLETEIKGEIEIQNINTYGEASDDVKYYVSKLCSALRHSCIRVYSCTCSIGFHLFRYQFD